MSYSENIKCVSIGKSWFESSFGGGSDRVLEKLHENFPSVGVDPVGLVVGEKRKQHGLQGVVDEDASLWKRGVAFRKAFSPDSSGAHVIAVHFALYAWFCRHQFGRTPVVVHFHGPWALESALEGGSRVATSIKKRIEKAVYRRGSLFITLSEAFADLLSKQYGVDRAKIRVIPGGADIARFGAAKEQEQARAQLGWAQDEIIFVAVRRLSKRMGLENLIQAIKVLAEEFDNVRLRIAGTGPEQENLASLISKLRLNDVVFLDGFVADETLPDYYGAANYSVVPSTGLEGFGLITVESMASGTPCLVTPIGGMPEIVKGLDPNMVIPGTTSQHIAEHLGAVIRGDIRVPDSPRCRIYAAENFSWSVVAERVRQVYLEAHHG